MRKKGYLESERYSDNVVTSVNFSNTVLEEMMRFGS